MQTDGRRNPAGLWSALAVLALLAASCAGSGEAASRSSGAFAFGTAGDPRDATTRVEVETLDEMAFSPSEIRVDQGETVLFVVTNSGKLPHELAIGDEAEQERHAEEMAEAGAMPHDHPSSVWLEAGETKEIAWQFGAPGEFLFGCHVAGHYEAGMVGTLVVE